MSSQYPNTRELRDWANSKQPGIVLDKGGLPRFVVLAWDKAHPDRPYVKSQAHHGTYNGYTGHGCRCDECCEAGRAYSLRAYHVHKADEDDAKSDALAYGDQA